ncbi:hypothetical protein B7463_g4636, partial [Scytalidium lignicola]
MWRNAGLALHEAGASQFATLIESDPDAAAFYFSNQVKTVFAPIDGARNASIHTNSSAHSSRRLRLRQASAATLQSRLYQSTSNLNSLGSMSSGSGLAMQSNAKSSGFGGKPLEFVSDLVSDKHQCIAVRQRDTGIYVGIDNYDICLLHYNPDFCGKHTVTVATTILSVVRETETETVTVPTIVPSTIISRVIETKIKTEVETEVETKIETERKTITEILPSTIVSLEHETEIITVTVPTTLPPSIHHETKFVTVTVPKLSISTVLSVVEEIKTVTVELHSTIVSFLRETKTKVITVPTTLTSTVVKETTFVTVSTKLTPTVLHKTITDTATQTIATPSEVDVTFTDIITSVIVSSTEIDVTITNVVTSIRVTPSEVDITVTDTLVTPSTVDVTITEISTVTIVSKSEVDVTFTETIASLSDVTVTKTIATPSEVEVKVTSTLSQETKVITIPTVVTSTISGETRLITISTVLTSTILQETTLVTPTVFTTTAPPETTVVTVPMVITSIIDQKTTLITMSTVSISTILRKTDLVTVPTISPSIVVSLIEETKTLPITVSPSGILTTAVKTVATQLYTIESTLMTPAPTPSLLKISSGLGNSVNIIQADIAYDGGLIHIVDDYFTLPENLIDTANANGQTTFTGLATSYGLMDTLDNTPGITYFIPNNEALSLPGATKYYSSIQNLLLGHLIPNFVGYLPSLKNGTAFKSQSGTNFTVTNDGCDYYVNNARIILPNVVLGNGVAHVIDQVIHPLATSPTFTTTPQPNSGSSICRSAQSLVAVGSVLMFIVMELLS